MAPFFIARTDIRISPCPRDKDDWEFFVRGGEFALKIKTTLARQSHVKNQAGRTIRRVGFEKVRRGLKEQSVQAKRSQQTGDRGSQIRIVVNNEDGGLRVDQRSHSQ
jgi:hypothetical protein